MVEGRNRRYLPERYWQVRSFLGAIDFQQVEDCRWVRNFQMATPCSERSYSTGRSYRLEGFQQVQPHWRGSQSANLEGMRRVADPARVVLAPVFQSQQFEPRRHS